MQLRCLCSAATVAMVLATLGCASSRSTSAGASSASSLADAPIKRPIHGKQASSGPTLDRQGCDPTGKASVQIKNGPNGQPSSWRYFVVVKRKGGAAKVLKCEAADNNNDGFVDARFFYDDNGQLMLEQRDLDFDGHAEVIADYSHFSAGHLVQAD
jgi:hypothetical protein